MFPETRNTPLMNARTGSNCFRRGRYARAPAEKRERRGRNDREGRVWSGADIKNNEGVCLALSVCRVVSESSEKRARGSREIRFRRGFRVTSSAICRTRTSLVRRRRFAARCRQTYSNRPTTFQRPCHSCFHDHDGSRGLCRGIL